jgi:hypothetical protein
MVVAKPWAGLKSLFLLQSPHTHTNIRSLKADIPSGQPRALWFVCLCEFGVNEELLAFLIMVAFITIP